jgi:urea transport system ATP-binding protein
VVRVGSDVDAVSLRRVLALLREQGQMAILLVEQYLKFTRGLADRLAVMDRGQVVHAGRPDQLDDADVRRHLTA